VKVVSWNILQGGGKRLDDICHTLCDWRPDIVTLQEARRSSVEQLNDSLASCGLTHHFLSDTESASENTLYIASREPLDAGDFQVDRSGPCHILEAETMGLTLLPVHFPQKALQIPLFEAVLADTPSLLERQCLLLGDMNCGIPFQDSTDKTFVNTRYFQALKQAGWNDLYRQCHGEKAQDFSWISPRTGRGFRYDHAMASASLAQATSHCQYVHEVREKGLSDHSALIVDVSI
jgi:exonuclease III